MGHVREQLPEHLVGEAAAAMLVGVRIYIDIVSRWHKRGSHAIGRLSPANIDPERLTELSFAQAAPSARTRRESTSPEETTA